MQQWYVIQTLSSQEKKVKKSILEQRQLKGINDQVENVLIPVENVSEVKKGEHRVVEKNLWPGYLLVKMALNDDTWMYIKETPGVIGFLGGEKPTPLTDAEVQDILKDLEKKATTVVQKHKFAIGDNVKIIEGVFVNFIGTVIDIHPDKGTLSVHVSIFGRETRVDDLEFTQVEEVTDEDKVV